MEPTFDVWLHGFSPNRADAAHELSRVFGIPLASAEGLVARLPRVVRRDASYAHADRIVQALEAIGGLAQAVPTRVSPAPVVFVGAAPASSASGAAGTNLDAARSSAAELPHDTLVERMPAGALAARGDETLTLGSDTAAFGERLLLQSVPPIAEPHAGPAPLAAAWHELQLDLEPAPRPQLEVERTEHAGAASWVQQTAHAFNSEQSWAHPLALRPSAPPPVGLPMRAATDRLRDSGRPNVQRAAQAARAHADRKQRQQLWTLIANGELSAAMRLHPHAGFALVLVATACLFALALDAL